MYRLPKTFIAILLFFALSSISIISTKPPTVDPIGAYLNNKLPKSTPGSAGSWDLEDAMPDVDIPYPVRISNIPDSDDFFLLSKSGKVFRVSFENQTQVLVLNITDQTYSYGEEGAVGMVLHPKFGDSSAPDKQQVFIYYRTKPNIDQGSTKGYNRLSKFNWDEPSQTFDKSSEEILIQQYDRDNWHNGGGLFFGTDDFLYLSVGDEGGSNPDLAIMLQATSTQEIDAGFFSGILRIDVDNDPTRSHPIRRQPLPNAPPPGGWWDTYSQG